MSNIVKKGVTISLTWPMIFTLVFVILKAFGYLNWSWLWVFAPLWIPVSIFGVVVTIWAILIIIIGLKDRKIW